MYITTTMSEFEAGKNRKAFLYTTIILIVVALIAIYWTWIIPPPPAPLVQDMIEINLGNLGEGMGVVQPLIKGEKSPGDSPAEPQKQAAAPSNPAPAKEQLPDESKDADAIPVVKHNKAVTKPTNTPTPPVTQPVKNPAPAVVQVPKPQKPKIQGYGGPKNGKGNGADETNGYNYQGNKPGGKGDAGDPNGKPDSYGNTPGGRTGSVPKVTNGDRKIIRYYSFTADLPKATIYAVIKVSPDGRGTFVGFDKGSTSSDSRYATAIRGYLPNIQFSKADHESQVTVPFNFRVQ